MIDRRTAPRVHYTGGLLPPALRVRPGRDVIVVNLSPGGTLVESRFRFRPGSMVDVLLHHAGTAQALRARIERCLVATLTDPSGVRYRTALRFETTVAVEPPRHLLDGYVLPTLDTCGAEVAGTSYPKPGEGPHTVAHTRRNVQSRTNAGMAPDLV